VSPLINEGTDLVMRFGAAGGQTIVTAGSPLTRLNYFDGKFLRADDLRREQTYFRQLVQFSNQGLGPGVVYGMDTVLDRQGRLSIGAGVAMDSVGRTLLIGSTATLDIAALIDASRRSAPDPRRKSVVAGGPCGGADFSDCVDVTGPPTDGVTPAGSLYVICVAHAESLCGTEDVYGRLCEEACVTATDRPLVVEGVIVRALPLTLRTPLATSHVTLDRRHLRSLVASAYFEDERHIVASLISGAGLALDTWCVGAELSPVACVPLAVIARAGTTTVFLDAWTVRRERIETPAKRYWAWRMAMRPWDVFLAQVLQFQCQLHEVLDAEPSDPSVPGPCAPQQQVLNETAKYLEAFDQSYTRHIGALSKLGEMPAAFQKQDAMFRLNGGVADLIRLRQRIDGALKVVVAGTRERVLITGGIVELPSAGYLPVVPGVVTVNEQVRRLLGEGLDLRFCIVRPDFVPHALEEAQHMERISLLAGIDDPAAKPEVDILVPNGDLLSASVQRLAGFDTQVRLAGTFGSAASGTPTAATNAIAVAPLIVHGAGRADWDGIGAAFHFAGAQEARTVRQIVDMVHGVDAFVGATPSKRATILRDAIRTGGVQTPFVRDVGLSDPILSRVISRFANTVAAGAPGAAAPAAAATTRRAAKRSAALHAALAVAANTPKPLVGVWATLRSERDPFALGVAESTAMKAEFALTSEAQAAAGTTHTLLRVRVFATFSVTQAPTDGAAGRTMSGHLSGSYSTEVFREATANAGTAEPFDVDVVLLRTGNAESGTLRARFGNASQLQWAAEASWGGQPLEATLKVSLIAGQRLIKAGIQNEMEVLSASALASDDALVEGNPLRRLSTAALDLIGEELTRAAQNGAAFADAAGRLLFPPPPPPVDDLTVRGTLDWVLFHRRRTKRCGQSVAQLVPTPPRRYQLFTYHAKSQEEVAALRRWLHSPIRLEPTFQRVDVLEFASGAATLVTPATALVSDWTAAQPGRFIAYGAVATPIAGDTPLAEPRLTRVVQGVSAVTPLDSGTDLLEVLPAVPAPLVVPNVDGIVVLITRDPVVVTRTALVIFTSMDGPNHFPRQDAPVAKVKFANNLPQADDLRRLIRSLTPNQLVNGITLAVLTAPVDGGADVRIQSVIDELNAAGRLAPLRRATAVLDARDRQELIRSGHPVDGLDEVIFLESNPQR
jgi:hypothetical protein